jgi:hypothetical protein
MLIFFLRHVHISNGSTDSCTLYIVTRGLAQEGVFGGLKEKIIFPGGLSLPPNFHRAFFMVIEKVG